MTNQRRGQPEETEMDAGSRPSQPVIPDGGLGAGMPEWLRQTPSWKRTSEATGATPVRALPAPDTSVIDPRRLIGIDDLPGWLQALSAREKDAPVVASQRQGGNQSAVSVSSSAAPFARPADRGLDVPPPRTELATTARDTDVTLDRPVHVPLTESPPAPARPWWLSDAAIGVLFVAIILTVIYVVLVASGVI